MLLHSPIPREWTMSDSTDHPSRRRLNDRLGSLVTHYFETLLNGFALLLLIAAAALVIVGSVQAITESVATKQNALEGGVLVLDRILLVLIIAEIAYTLRTVIESHEIAPEPFLFIGLIATVRRILIVTARFEQPQSNERLDQLMVELGVLGLLVLAIATAILIVRVSSSKVSHSPEVGS
ncbi:phosphate-starvation-inducible PsiE family protein [Mycobacterium sp. 050128]|uniref:phosphate-starvation-inducible PsiE family protein n=1 Tax=Mycobacterium sp. 050128 TaxID=3096112 RepID=UPI002ED80367